MLLRRFMVHIKEQNWFAVSLDILVVIVGIFLGMQVTEWNEERNETLLESQYMQRLLDDMNNDINDSERTDRWNAKRVETQALALKSLREGNLKSDDIQEFNRGLYWAGVLNPIQRRWHTVEELKSTGNFSILRDINLRNRIADLETIYMRNQKIISISENQIQMLRVELSKYMDVISVSGTIDGDVDIKYDFESLKNHQELINMLSMIHAESQNAIAFRNGYYEALKSFRDELTLIINER